MFSTPQRPDDVQGARFDKAFKYVFCLLEDKELATDFDLDEVVSKSGRYVEITLPQQISLTEPFATAVRVMQEGGIVVDSRGHVLKVGAVSGTTGFMPNPPAALRTAVGSGQRSGGGRRSAVSSASDEALGRASGFRAFLDLRYLFRLYGDWRRQGRTDVSMHWFDFKSDDFFRIEPDSFALTRSPRRPFSYDYSIQFKCIATSDAHFSTSFARPEAPLGGYILNQTDWSSQTWADDQVGAASAQRQLANMVLRQDVSRSTSFPTIKRFAEMVQSGTSYLRYLSTKSQRFLQSTLRDVDAIVGFFENIVDTAKVVLDVPLAYLAQLDNSLAGLLRVIDKYTPANVSRELNEWWLEVTTLSDHLWAQLHDARGSQTSVDADEADYAFTHSRMRGGATTDLLTEPTDALGSPDVLPLLGANGLGLVTDVEAMGGTCAVDVVLEGEDIYTCARRLLGTTSRFIDLVIGNGLVHPYIVPRGVTRGSNVLTWGDTIRYPSASARPARADVAGESAPAASGTVTASGTAVELVDAGQAWRDDQWIGYLVTATTGGASETRVAVGNTADTLVVNLAWSITITPAVTTYTVALVLFDARRPRRPAMRAFGRDLLVRFGSDGKADLVFGSRRDLAWISGDENFLQALQLRSACPIGDHPVHRTYGMPLPIGKAAGATSLLHLYMMRASLLSDPRTGAVRNASLQVDGDRLYLDAEVQPVNALVARPLRLQVG